MPIDPVVPNSTVFSIATSRILYRYLFWFGLAAIIFLGVVFYNFTLEDSFISFRYAEHLAEGYGLGAWNIGESPVEGYTSLLWVLLLGGAKLVGISTLTSAKIFGWIFWAATFLLFCQFGRFLKSSPSIVLQSLQVCLIACVYCFSFPVGWYALSGMETPLYCFALLLFVELFFQRGASRSFTDILAGILVILIRPEGTAIVLSAYGLSLLLERPKPFFHSIYIKKIAWLVFGIALLTLWRIWYYGDPLPNTFYAKADGGVDHWLLGIRYFRQALTQGGFMVALFPIGVIIWRFVTKQHIPRPLLLVMLLIGVYWLVIVYTGGDNPYAFPYYRHFVHQLPLLLIAIIMSISLLPKHKTAWSVLGFVVLVVMFNRTSVLNSGQIKTDIESIPALFAANESPELFSHQPPKEYTRWIKEKFPHSTVIAVALAGELPYYTDFTAIDMLGLNDRHIAHFGASSSEAVDTKSDMKYVLDRSPDLIESVISMRKVLEVLPPPKDSWREKMENDMLSDIHFQENYLFVVNAPYESWPRALFIRRDFWEKLPNSGEIQVKAVTETALYQ